MPRETLEGGVTTQEDATSQSIQIKYKLYSVLYSQSGDFPDIGCKIGKGKDKVLLRTGHESQEGEQCIALLFLQPLR